MIRRPPSSTRTDTLFPYTTLFRSVGADAGAGDVDALLEDQNRWRPAQLDPRGPGPQQLHLPDESDLLLLVVAQCGLHDVRLVEVVLEHLQRARGRLALPVVLLAATAVVPPPPHRRGVGSQLGLAELPPPVRSEEHTSDLQSLMRHSSAVLCLNK